MKNYYKILIITLISSLWGDSPLSAMERKRNREFSEESTSLKRHKREESSNLFPNGTPLSDDKWVEIFSYLSPKKIIISEAEDIRAAKNIVHMGQVCRPWYRLTVDLCWPMTVIDMSAINKSARDEWKRKEKDHGWKDYLMPQKDYFINVLIDLFPNPKPYNIKISIKEGELELHPVTSNFLQSFYKLNLGISRFQSDDYRDRYTELSKRLQSTTQRTIYFEDWSAEKNTDYNDKDLQKRLTAEMDSIHVRLKELEPSPPLSSSISSNLTNLTSLQLAAWHKKFNYRPSPFRIGFPLYTSFSAISTLANLKTLTSLRFPTHCIHPDELHHVTSLINLTSLKTDNYWCGAKSYSEATIALHNKKSFWPFARLTNLTALSLKNYESGVLGEVEMLSDLTSLTSLNLRQAIQSNFLIDNYENMKNFPASSTNLTKLNFSCVPLNPDTFENLSKLTKLVKLDLSAVNQYPKKALIVISNLTNLTDLNVDADNRDNTECTSFGVDMPGYITSHYIQSTNLTDFLRNFNFPNSHFYHDSFNNGVGHWRLKEDWIPVFRPLIQLKESPF